MKKIIMLLTVAAMLATSVIGVSAVDYTAGEDGKYTGVAYSGLTANEYYGVVVVKGTTATTVDFSDLENILYIDQVTADENGAITIPAFMTKGDELLEGTIFIGGEGLPTATNIGYLKLAQSEEPEMIVISGTIEGNEGPTAPTVVVTDGNTNYTATVTENAFSVEVPAIEDGAYILTTSKTGYLPYTKSNISDTVSNIKAVLKAGDVVVDETSAVNLQDLLALLDYYGDAVTTIERDYNEDGYANLQDLLKLLDYYGHPAVSE